MQASIASPQALAKELSAFWTHIQRTSSGEWFRTIAESDLSLTQLKALYRLSGGEAPTVKDLAEGLGLSLPAASRGVEGLVKRGLVERWEDEQDRRARRVRLSSTGRETLAQLDAARLAGLSDFVATLPAEQREALHAALDPILKDLAR